jgi:nucleotide-binding universal stress UspA family protein
MPMTILAIVAEPQTAHICLTGALAAAAVDPAARIEVFHVKVDPARLIRAPEEISIQRLREHDEGTAADREAAVRRIYEAWLAQVPPDQIDRVRWRTVVGAEEEMVLKEARAADLLVLARPHNMDGDDAMHAAIYGSRRPLLVPPDWSPSGPDALGHHIAIAWKPTLQAHHAVEGAGPWLRRAERVSLIVIARDARAGGIDEAEHLAREIGFSAGVALIEPKPGEVGEQLLQAVAALRADALVLGAYRHNDMVEWALPSTTRHILAHAQVPLFLAH